MRHLDTSETVSSPSRDSSVDVLSYMEGAWRRKMRGVDTWPEHCLRTERACRTGETNPKPHEGKAEMSTKEKLEKVATIMKRWQRIENAAVSQTSQVMDETENQLIRLVMEIIQRDSNMHHRVQQAVIDSLERESINVFYDDLEKVWVSIEKHIAIEKKTIELAKSALEALEGTKNPVQQYLITYLLADEEKHDKLLDDLALVKKGMFP